MSLDDTTIEMAVEESSSIIGASNDAEGATPTSAKLEPPKTIYFHPKGDVKLLIGPDDGMEDSGITHIYIVSSAVMSLVCEPWNALMDPDNRFAESRSGEFKLLGDDPVALRILLQIAHLQFEKVPYALITEQLLQLAILTDKYQAIKLLIPFLRRWANRLVHDIDEPLSAGCERWLWIAWAFGFEGVFGRMASMLTFECTTNLRGDTLLYDGKELSEPVPCEILDTILKIREETVEKVMEAVGNVTDEMFTKSLAYSNCKAPSERKQACDTLTVGSLLAGLNRLGLRERLSPLKYTGSIGDMVKNFLKIEFHKLNTSEHPNCGLLPEFKKSINAVIEAMPSAVSEHHKTHIKEQQKILKIPLSYEYRARWKLEGL